MIDATLTNTTNQEKGHGKKEEREQTPHRKYGKEYDKGYAQNREKALENYSYRRVVPPSRLEKLACEFKNLRPTWNHKKPPTVVCIYKLVEKNPQVTAEELSKIF